MGSNQQFSLRWNNYINHITGAFDSLRSDEDLVDVTLSCEGKRIRAHKMLLSACSTYFRDLFKENPCPHPVIIFRNVKFEDLVALIDFMYQGEVNVVQDQLASFLTTAELLAVQGLSEGSYKDSNSREDDLANSPALPPEPEIQMTSSGHIHSQPESSSSTSGASPVSFVTTDPETESPCIKRRKKSSSAVQRSNPGTDVASKCSERENDSDRNFSNQSNGDSSTAPSEIIPVISNLKVEIPEYVEHDLSSTNYGETNRSVGNVTSGQEIKTERLSLSHSVPKRDSADDRNVEPPDVFCHNSRESSIPSVPESLSSSDIGQVLSKPGTSTERQAQDSLQAQQWGIDKRSSGVHYSYVGKSQFLCKTCGKVFYHRDSLTHHKSSHQGQTVCPICLKVFSRIYTMKCHMSTVHKGY